MQEWIFFDLEAMKDASELDRKEYFQVVSKFIIFGISDQAQTTVEKIEQNEGKQHNTRTMQQ